MYYIYVLLSSPHLIWNHIDLNLTCNLNKKNSQSITVYFLMRIFIQGGEIKLEPYTNLDAKYFKLSDGLKRSSFQPKLELLDLKRLLKLKQLHKK